MWFFQTNRSAKFFLTFGVLLGAVIILPTDVRSQAPKETSEATLASLNELAEQQKQLAEQFSKLEELFIRLSELEAASNPTRAGLLQQAARLSKEQATSQRLASAAQLLDQKQYSRAIQEQQAARETLAKLLELLQSENRRERIREERDRIQALLKDVRRIERLQKSLRGRTENGADMMQSMQDQQKIESQTGELEQKLADEFQKNMPATESRESDPNSEKSGKDSPPNDQSPSPLEPTKSPQSSAENEAESKNDSQAQGDQQSQSSEQQQENAGKQSGSKSESRSSDSQQSQNPTPSDSNSGEESSKEEPEESEDSSTPEQETQRRVKAAQKRMQEAQKQLEKAKREEAVEKQRQAEQELAKAIEDLERILRQLREEEVERSLADLESRFRKMLEIQVSVLEDTQKLQELTGDAQDRQFEVGANRLANEERKILVEGQRAMLLLREEGSSEAFPQILEQILLDVDTVASSLTRLDLSAATVDIEHDIVTALEEMIEALNRTRKEREANARRSQQQSGGQQSGDDPLVDALSELKLVKTLQQRINQRTAALAKRIDDPNLEIGQAQTEDLKVQLRDLAARQQKIKEVTRALLLKAQEQQ